ncbi:ATP-dependent helicase HrpB [Lentzea xinjiangensis]|uniref:ATP-dependent helicase HrpB n=1 Tax=Lentzea xinjiangensis TaxID=402600 RepID=A0A1H9RZE6_9PSEU|nr:ATP-dependent helicase HrpB [Lentzea xinjiangensis]SER78131.1 ATP-dependent helicase HrpB [Lentzea xinjiangensis]
MHLPDLPVKPVLPELLEQLRRHGAAVLVAPPGTGKTTLVPLALHDEFDGKVLVAEPRRIAARAAAARMASLLGEPVGHTVGYSVRGDRRTSAHTRVEVVTSGLLVRRLQHDQELAGVGTVLLDECHERHLDADLLLSLLLDARAGLRPDLKLLATSATVAAQRLSELLGAPVLHTESRMFPTEITYVPPARNEHVENTVARAVAKALSEVDGDVLAFLPGVREINRTAALLDADTVVLHGQLSAQTQDAALRPGHRQRVVLATSIAESSLTVPGVRAVVDAGLARVPRVDHRRGLAGLATIRVSQAVADQRAGRAGREAPGRVYRCWPEHEHSTLPRYPEPEIKTADLTRLALELAVWGTPDGSGLNWWDAPPEGALKAARETLGAIGALEPGRRDRIANVGLHPRLGRALIDGSALAGNRTAAEVVALLDDSAHPATNDLATALKSPGKWRQEVKKLEKLGTGTPGTHPEGHGDPALVVALAYPERLAKRRSKNSNVYLMANGTAVEHTDSHAKWLAVAIADREPGSKHGRIRLAAPADEELAVTAAAALVHTVEDIRWNGDVIANQVRKLGAITLDERPLNDLAKSQEALRLGLETEGLGLLKWTDAAQRLRERMAFLHRTRDWPSVDDEHLIRAIDLGKARKRSDLAKIDTVALLRSLLPWPEGAEFDKLAPERIGQGKVDYTQDQPVLSVRIQDAMKWADTPQIAGVPVVVHLLSPAGRPTAVTSDLRSFWRNGYLKVRSELKGRYPKHHWPERPWDRSR